MSNKTRTTISLSAAVLLIIGVIITAIKFKNIENIAPKKSVEVTFEDTSIYNSAKEGRIEGYKEKESDIAGMTQYDKYEAGLIPFDHSDTDGDGLSDKAEIEQYGSDPLKASTSGDLYSDGYKVKNGMDLSTVYEYDLPYVFPNNQCQEVSLVPTQASDLNAVVRYAGRAEDSYGFQSYLEYEIYSFSGTLSIDLSALYEKYGISENDITVYLDVLNNPVKADCSFSGNILNIDTALNGDHVNYIYIIEKGSDSKVKRTLSSLDSGLDDLIDDVSGEGLPVKALAVYSPLLAGFAGKAKVYLTGEDPELVKTMLQRLRFESVNGPEFVEEKTIQYITPTEYELKYKILQTILPSFEFTFTTMSDQPYYQFLITYYTDEDIAEQMRLSAQKEAEEAIPEEEPIETFGYYDQFRFTNFSTDKTPDGTCLGMAWAAAYKHNHRVLPENSTLYNDAGDIVSEWDIRGEADDVFFDPHRHLYSYKSDDPVPLVVNGHLKDNLTDGEKNVVEMLVAAWIEGNSQANKYSQPVRKDQSAYKKSSFEKVLSALENDQAILMGFADEDTGHCIDISACYVVDAEEKTIENNFDPGYLYLLEAYDSNHPDRGYTFEVTPYPDPVTGEECLRFRYQYNRMITDPTATVWDSDSLDEYTIVFLNDNLDVIFGTEDDIAYRYATE